MTENTNNLMSVLDSYLAARIEEGWFPGTVYSVFCTDTVLAGGYLGFSEIVPEKIPMQPDSIFDIASLTKPIATATAVMKLVLEKKVGLNTSAGKYFPEFCNHPKSAITIRHLLSHSSGLPAWVPAYAYGSTQSEMIRYILELPQEHPPGSPVYGCPNYILLGYLVQKLAKMDLNEFSRNYVFRPLDMNDTCYLPPKSLQNRIVATEWGNTYEKKLAGNAGMNCRNWRNGVIKGTVHDHNAYSMGGISGNAGLFSTVGDMEKFGRFLLKRKNHKVLPEEFISLMTSVHASDDMTRWGLGWKLNSVQNISFGRRLSGNSFGHTGFTGCSMIIDPDRELGIILATNRVHPVCKEQGIDRIRSEFHDLVIETMHG